ncbi:P-loop containing nucleoside triphosphate hydrolase protein [Rhizoclosmatium globosum]|uniref:RNA helicase n=1 Tax=Rhizoclosmatium globosum TaxID=329046 RepID=A0A1Y2B332_9FUNG|nr:P-loop containing nucleoside triphosphate hydrolase protein [Rhizoclosmatium globosum]|eukprot:ORY29239.1 P-loop containing nucleoside triphosphate hydrolase protein [Rhizoclosmatium globosum]
MAWRKLVGRTSINQAVDDLANSMMTGLAIMNSSPKAPRSVTQRPSAANLNPQKQDFVVNNLADIPDAVLPFLDAFKETLLKVPTAARLAHLETVDKLKDAYRLFRDFCRQRRNQPSRFNEHEKLFESRYKVNPIFPLVICEIMGAPSLAVLYLTRHRVLQKYGRPRTKVAFLVTAENEDLGIATKYNGRVNINELQPVLCSSAPRTIENDTVGLFSIGTTYTVSFEIHNGYNFPRRIVNILAEEDPSTAQLSFQNSSGGTVKSVLIQKNSPFQVVLKLSTQHIGFFSRRIVFLIDNFRIDRVVQFRIVADAENPNLEFPTASIPYKPRKIVIDDNAVPAIPGEAPPRPEFDTFKYELPKYTAPPSLKRLFDQDSKAPKDKKPQVIQSFTSEALTWETFSRRFHSMLYLEEFQMVVDIRAYDQLGETLEPLSNNSLLRLMVPGLAENRPSVLYGDKIIVKLGNGQRYEGYVHKVELNSVNLKFDQKFHRGVYIKGMKVDVEFNFSRTCFKRAHRSLDLIGFVAKQASCWTFPVNVPMTKTETANLQDFEIRRNQLLKNVTLNTHQIKAVAQIVSKRESQTPFVIFGPPGTGKTKTLVEAVKLALRMMPNARILVTAPSNAAVDLIVHRLSDAQPGGLPPSQMIRVNAYTRSPESVPHFIARYSLRDDRKGIYVIPKSQSELSTYRVVCTTLYTASALQGMGAFDPVPGPNGALENWFTHIFCDEVGHATETEFWAGVGGAVSPMLKVLKEKDVKQEERSLFKKIAGDFNTSKNNVVAGKLPQLVIVGDPKQLGPIVRSDLAEQCGYSMSYLERLVETCSAYGRKGGDDVVGERYQNPHNIVQLVDNYRSHPAILELYSKTFYDGDLVCCAKNDGKLSRLSWLPNRNEFPLVFHGVCGKDEREGSSPSWFNMDEVNTVLDYLKTLLTGASPPKTGRGGGLFGSNMFQTEKASNIGLTMDEIGIITPYRKQIDKIRARLQKEGWSRIRVGTVEEFQGDEKKVIILSTVRSSAQWIEKDQKFNIGFLRNPKRFNVSISRAKSLMIIIGNPEILCGDKYWEKLVRYCEVNGACVGYPVPKEKVGGSKSYGNLVEEDYASEEEDIEVRDVQGVGWRRDE